MQAPSARMRRLPCEATIAAAPANLLTMPKINSRLSVTAPNAVRTTVGRAFSFVNPLGGSCDLGKRQARPRSVLGLKKSFT